MHRTDNTILVTGGGSGIGLGLAAAFHARGNRVIIAGRRRSTLEEAAALYPSMQYRVLDQDDAGEICRFAERITEDFPDLNVLVNNAGIQRVEDLTRSSLADAEATITTNLLGPVRLTAGLLPALLASERATILNVTSGLAFVPSAMLPTYCATKAALHSYTQSLRFQLRQTRVEVVEIVPPWVQTELQGERGMNPRAMPLPAYIAETMAALDHHPAPREIISERGAAMRWAERDGRYDTFFEDFNGG